MLLLGVYVRVGHPWLMNWGTTLEEQQAHLPGDAPASEPAAYFTRAISIDASPEAIWPWLLQIGQDRAGFYSYTWLENLTGANIHNGDEIRPEWQQRALGDRVPMTRPSIGEPLLGEVMYLRIVALEPNRTIANLPARFVLLAPGDGQTRLLLREPFGSDSPGAGPNVLVQAAGYLIWDPMHFVMEQRMLRGIKERAEGVPLTPAWLLVTARAGWLLAGIGLVGLYASRARWRFWLLLPIGVAAPALLAAGDVEAALAGFLALGISLLGALAFGRRWTSPFLLLGSGVLLILLLAPDAYVAFGLIFDALAVAALVAVLGLRNRGRGIGQPRRGRATDPAT
ncbi:MAG: hypothetical protein IT305_28370 [Chloroflexi bacterium]|nr:hypothetical protein [Chloroflexota bacterium]